MITLPADIMTLLSPFRQLFSHRVWEWVQVLVVGAMLAPGKRTVTAALHVMGLKDEPQFQNYHRVLNRVKWCGLGASRLLLGLLVETFVGRHQPLIVAAGETLERRRASASGPRAFSGMASAPVMAISTSRRPCAG